MKRIFYILMILFLTACSVNEQKNKDEIEMPVLPDIDFKETDFFDDGYQEVELKACTDGDTAVFVIDGLSVPTRFLAVDTPETSNGVDPWGVAAKRYTCDKLTNAKQIVLENDSESDVWDKYNRLLAWIWVDGELLQYKLVEESLAWVKYLYGDYKYNTTMIRLENKVQKNDLKIWGEDDPEYKYETDTIETNLVDLEKVKYYDKVIVTGIITGVVGNNAFIQDGEGAVYVYTNNRPFKAFIEGPGTKIKVSATYTLYNGLDELSNINVGDIEIISTGNPLPEPEIVSLDQLGEEYESKLIKLEDVTITDIKEDSSSKGYDVIVEKEGLTGVIRVDKYLNPFIETSFFEIGSTIDITGNLGQYQSTYQIMIRTESDVLKK